MSETYQANAALPIDVFFPSFSVSKEDKREGEVFHM